MVDDVILTMCDNDARSTFISLSFDVHLFQSHRHLLLPTEFITPNHGLHIATIPGALVGVPVLNVPFDDGMRELSRDK